MQVFGSFSLTIAATFMSLSNGQMYELVGDGLHGFCAPGSHGAAWKVLGEINEEHCDRACRLSINYSEGLRGFASRAGVCLCLYENGTEPGHDLEDPNCPNESEFIWCHDAAYNRPYITLDTSFGCFRSTGDFPVPSVPVPDGIELVGHGYCHAPTGDVHHDYTYSTTIAHSASLETCHNHCKEYPQGLRGFSYVFAFGRECVCFYDDGYAPGGPSASTSCPDDRFCQSNQYNGEGEIDMSTNSTNAFCWKYTSFPVVEATGDPHFRTWKNEHFEFHGQCDIVMTKVKNFADQGMDLDIHLRTKMVRYWSYIKTVAIRIGNDILEVEGLKDFSLSYWINYEHNGELVDLGGFPVKINKNNDRYTIDLGSKFPGQKIEIKTFKEFVGVKIIGSTEESFGNAVGITGDFKTGNTLARDGTTVLHDFNELGLEWQVLPSDGKLFHEAARPRFPELCYLPEDPRGDRTRRLEESDISEEAAELACAQLKDEFDRKACVYDILATQDLDMVGAY